jgi:hypothetical protein
MKQPKSAAARGCPKPSAGTESGSDRPDSNNQGNGVDDEVSKWSPVFPGCHSNVWQNLINAHSLEQRGLGNFE